MDHLRTVKDAKAFCVTATDSDIVQMYRHLKARTQMASVSRFTQITRVMDKLFVELRKRGGAELLAKY